MPKFTGRVVLAADQFAIYNDTDADAVRNADKNYVVQRRTVTGCRPYLREGAGLTRIFEVNIDAVEFALQRFEQVNISPFKRRSVQHNTGISVEHTGNDDAHAVANRVLGDVAQGSSYLGA